MSHELTDTRITAYIFAELSPEQTAAFERELVNSTELQEELAAIRETLGALKSEFEARSAGVGDSQRQAIEEAIHSRSSTDKVGLNDSTNETSRRRLVVMAVMAASLLIVVGLAYPYLQSQTGRPVSMHDPASSPEIIAATKSGAEADEQVAELVETFNSFINEERYEEAEVLSKQVAQLKPGDPIADAMSRNSQMGQRLQALKEEQSKKVLDFIDNSTITPADSAPITYPDANVWSDMSRRRMERRGQITEVLEGSLAEARELNEASDDSGIATRSNSERRFDTEYEFGLRPRETTAGDSLMGEDADDFGDVADLDMEGMMGGKGLPADFDGDDVFGGAAIESATKGTSAITSQHGLGNGNGRHDDGDGGGRIPNGRRRIGASKPGGA